MARPLYITSGEPAGIGPDICLSLAERLDQRPLVVSGRSGFNASTCPAIRN